MTEPFVWVLFIWIQATSRSGDMERVAEYPTAEACQEAGSNVIRDPNFGRAYPRWLCVPAPATPPNKE